MASHIPELGIESNKRQALDSFEDYPNLFSDYGKTTLKQNAESIKNIYGILMKNKKTAITCFEADKNIGIDTELLIILIMFIQMSLMAYIYKRKDKKMEKGLDYAPVEFRKLPYCNQHKKYDLIEVMVEKRKF